MLLIFSEKILFNSIDILSYTRGIEILHFLVVIDRMRTLRGELLPHICCHQTALLLEQKISSH